VKKLALVCVLALVSLAAVADTKLGYIDGSKIIAKYEPIVDAKLNTEFKSKQDALTAMQKKLVDQSDKYNRDSAVMSDEDKKKMQDGFSKDQAEYQRMSGELNKARSDRGNQELEKLLAQVKTAAADIAKKVGYTAVLQRAAAIYIVDESADITDQVMAKLDYK
jgi:outer membrane protein